MTRVEFTYQTWHGISLGSIEAVIAFLVVALLIGRRGFCHTICWMPPFMVLGQAVRNRLRLPGLHLKANSDACISCGTCTCGCPTSLDVQAMVKKESMAATECVLCGSCADGCPKDGIALRFSQIP